MQENIELEFDDDEVPFQAKAQALLHWIMS
jgi:hypothetical protein